MACTLQPDVNQEPCTHPHSVLCLKTKNAMNDMPNLLKYIQYYFSAYRYKHWIKQLYIL